MEGSGSENPTHEVADSIVLEEEIDPNYVPSENEVIEYAKWLGMDLEKDLDLFWIAREGLMAPLPKSWKPCKTKDTEDIYYFNFSTGESTWDHPCDGYYKRLYEEEKKKKEIGIKETNDVKRSKAKQDVEQLLGKSEKKKKRSKSITAETEKSQPVETLPLAKIERKPLPGISGLQSLPSTLPSSTGKESKLSSFPAPLSRSLLLGSLDNKEADDKKQEDFKRDVLLQPKPLPDLGPSFQAEAKPIKSSHETNQENKTPATVTAEQSEAKYPSSVSNNRSDTEMEKTLRIEKEKLSFQVNQLLSDKSNLQEQLRKLEEKVSTELEKSHALAKANTTLQTKNDSVEQQLETLLKEKDSLLAKNDEQETKNSSIAKQLLDLEKENIELKVELKNIQQSETSLKTKVEEVSNELSAAKRLLEDQNSLKSKLSAALIETKFSLPSKYSLQLGTIGADTSATVLQQFQDLRSTIRTFTEEFTMLISKPAQDSSFSAPAIATSEQTSQQLVASNSRIASLEAEIAQLKNDKSNADQKIKLAQDRDQQQNQNISSITEELQKKDLECSGLKSEKLRVSNLLEQVNSELLKCKDEVNITKSLLITSEERLKQSSDSSKALEEMKVKHDEEVRMLQAEQMKLKNDNSSLSQSLKESHKTADQLRESYTQMLESSKKNNNNDENANLSLLNTILKLQDELSDMRIKHHEMGIQEQSLRDAISEKESQVSQIKVLESSFTEQRKLLALKDTQVKSHEHEISSLISKVRELEKSNIELVEANSRRTLTDNASSQTVLHTTNTSIQTDSIPEKVVEKIVKERVPYVNDDSNNEIISQQQEEIDTLTSEISSSKSEVCSLKGEISRLKSSISAEVRRYKLELEKLNSKNSEEVKQLEEELFTKKIELQKVQDNLVLKTKQLELIEQTKLDLNNKNLELVNSLETTKYSFEKMKNTNYTLELQLSELQKMNSELSMNKSSENHQNTVKVQSLEKDLELKKTEISRLQSELQSTKELASNLRSGDKNDVVIKELFDENQRLKTAEVMKDNEINKLRDSYQQLMNDMREKIMTQNSYEDDAVVEKLQLAIRDEIRKERISIENNQINSAANNNNIAHGPNRNESNSHSDFIKNVFDLNYRIGQQQTHIEYLSEQLKKLASNPSVHSSALLSTTHNNENSNPYHNFNYNVRNENLLKHEIRDFIPTISSYSPKKELNKPMNDRNILHKTQKEVQNKDKKSQQSTDFLDEIRFSPTHYGSPSNSQQDSSDNINIHNIFTESKLLISNYTVDSDHLLQESLLKEYDNTEKDFLMNITKYDHYIYKIFHRIAENSDILPLSNQNNESNSDNYAEKTLMNNIRLRIRKEHYFHRISLNELTNIKNIVQKRQAYIKKLKNSWKNQINKRTAKESKEFAMKINTKSSIINSVIDDMLEIQKFLSNRNKVINDLVLLLKEYEKSNMRKVSEQIILIVKKLDKDINNFMITKQNSSSGISHSHSNSNDKDDKKFVKIHNNFMEDTATDPIILDDENLELQNTPRNWNNSSKKEWDLTSSNDYLLSNEPSVPSSNPQKHQKLIQYQISQFVSRQYESRDAYEKHAGWLGSLSKEVGHFQFGSQKSSKALHALDINKEKDYQYPFTKSYEPYDDLPVYDI